MTDWVKKVEARTKALAEKPLPKALEEKRLPKPTRKKKQTRKKKG